jgi:hypothetical protein
MSAAYRGVASSRYQDRRPVKFGCRSSIAQIRVHLGYSQARSGAEHRQDNAQFGEKSDYFGSITEQIAWNRG